MHTDDDLDRRWGRLRELLLEHGWEEMKQPGAEGCLIHPGTQEAVCPPHVIDIHKAIVTLNKRISTCEDCLARGFDYAGAGESALSQMHFLRDAIKEVFEFHGTE